MYDCAVEKVWEEKRGKRRRKREREGKRGGKRDKEGLRV